MTQLLLFNVIGFVEVALTVLIIARIAVSWIGLSPWHPVVRWLRIIVDPILAPFRRILPTFSGIDFSPILAIVVINFVAQILQTLVLGGGITAGRPSRCSSSSWWSTSRSRSRSSCSSASCSRCSTPTRGIRWCR